MHEQAVKISEYIQMVSMHEDKLKSLNQNVLEANSQQHIIPYNHMCLGWTMNVAEP